MQLRCAAPLLGAGQGPGLACLAWLDTQTLLTAVFWDYWFRLGRAGGRQASGM